MGGCILDAFASACLVVSELAVPCGITMRIGFILPANYALAGPGNGVRAQAIFQAAALERAGHDVVRLHPWNLDARPEDLDVVQFFLGGYANYTIEVNRPHPVRMLVLRTDHRYQCLVQELLVRGHARKPFTQDFDDSGRTSNASSRLEPRRVPISA